MAASQNQCYPCFTSEDDINLWHFPLISDLAQSMHEESLSNLPQFEEPVSFLNLEGASTLSLDSQSPIPEFVHPQSLLTSPTSAGEGSPSLKSRRRSLDSIPYPIHLDGQQLQRRLSQAKVDLSADEPNYRPRKSPTRARKKSTSRVTPRSEKHARALEQNRKAATKCRNRKREYVENLQKRCFQEKEKIKLQTELVHDLQQELLKLREQVLRQNLSGLGVPSI